MPDYYGPNKCAILYFSISKTRLTRTSVLERLTGKAAGGGKYPQNVNLLVFGARKGLFFYTLLIEIDI